jgi:hypothetical protein
LQVTVSPAAFSLLHMAAADHWAYSSKEFNCWVVISWGATLATESSREAVVCRLTSLSPSWRGEGERRQGEAGEDNSLHGSWFRGYETKQCDRISERSPFVVEIRWRQSVVARRRRWLL